MDKLDFKKEYKDLYLPKTFPATVDVPEMTFIAVDGKGDPNTEGGEYQQAIQALYALTYAIKMSKMGDQKPEGYFEYVVPPLEGFWQIEGDAEFDAAQKDKFVWTSVIRQPEFVDQKVFDWACGQITSKKPEIDISKARLMTFTEGLCVQCMHVGSYDSEPATIAKINEFIGQNGFAGDFSQERRHHEIYLGDPRKVEEDKRRTVIRHPIKRAAL